MLLYIVDAMLVCMDAADVVAIVVFVVVVIDDKLIYFHGNLHIVVGVVVIVNIAVAVGVLCTLLLFVDFRSQLCFSDAVSCSCHSLTWLYQCQ